MEPTSLSKIAELVPDSSAPLIVWRIVDGKPGHDNQSRGLVNALSRLVRTVSLDIPEGDLRFGLLQYLLGRYPPGNGLNKPDFITGAGHRTHLSVLCAKRAFGGRSVIIMKPGLPAAWFDLCLIPEHDNMPAAKNCVQTRGAINAVVPSNRHELRQGLIMIGGPSRHYDWDQDALMKQIGEILKRTPGTRWTITDSRRTPAVTRDALKKLDHAEFRPHENTGEDWLPEHLAVAGQVWVTADSISMLYESLTAGAATGVLSVPCRRKNKLTRSVQNLINTNVITSFDEWLTGHNLRAPAVTINEADRCARLLLAFTGRASA